MIHAYEISSRQYSIPSCLKISNHVHARTMRCFHSDFSHLRTLLMAGADANARDNKGRTALMVGVLEYDEAAPTLPGLRALLAHGQWLMNHYVQRP